MSYDDESETYSTRRRMVSGINRLQEDRETNQFDLITAALTRNVNINSLPKFGSSLNDDVLEYLQQLDLSLTFYNLPDEQKAKLIPLTLSGRPYTFFLTLPVTVRSDYRLLTNALKNEFDSPQLKYKKRQELYGIKQNGDNLTKYFSRLESLSQHLDISDQVRMDIMISGLDRPYKEYVLMQQPEDYQKATHLLLLKEAVDPPESDLVMQEVLATVQSIQQAQSYFDVEEPGEENTYDHKYSDHTGNERDYYRAPICYYCGIPGHIQRFCRQRNFDGY